MTPRAAPDGRALRGAAAWAALAMAAVFLPIAALFVAAPALGAAVFGIPAPDGAGLAYVRALGLRDLALGLYLLGLLRFSSRRAVAVVLGATVVIPAGDMLLVLGWEGLSSPGHLLLHGLSAACSAAVALWLFWSELGRAGPGETPPTEMDKLHVAAGTALPPSPDGRRGPTTVTRTP